MGRKCAVPHCYTGYRKCIEKAPLYRVPDDDYFLSKWQEAIAREDRPITPKDYVCGKHFKEDDILRTRTVKDTVEVYQRPRLKPDAIPSVFPDLPEFIPKMVKKRRKLDQREENDEHFASKDNTDNDQTNEITVKKEIRDDISEEAENGCNSIRNKEIEIKSEIDDSAETLSEKDQASIDDPLGELDTAKGYSKRKKMHYCNHCEYKTKYPHNLRTHQAKHLSGEEAYMRCPHCPDYKTKWELTYRNHLKNKHGMRRIEQETLRKHIRSQQEEEQELEKEDTSILEQFRCNHPGCESEFDSEALLEEHNLTHTSETIEKQKSFKCTECYYETNSKTHILKHIKTVHITGDDTLVSVNAKNFDFSNRRNGKSIYKCLKCPYKTRFHTLLLKHIYRHKNINVEPEPIEPLPVENKCKVWKCPKCPYATFFEQSMQKHRELECDRINFNCSECTFFSDSKPDYLRHILTHRNTAVETVKQLEEIKNGSEHSLENIVTSTEGVTVKEEFHE